MTPLPKWIDEFRQGFSMAATDGMKLEGREDYRLFEALSIAWEALVHIQERDPILTIDEIAQDAMRRIEEMK